jgi:signal transduction histidine kinase
MGLAFLDRNRPAAESLEAGVLDDMRTALQRADGIVRDLLQLASPRPLDLALANLNEIIEQSLLLVNFQLNKAHVDVNREFAPNLPQVLVDRPRLQQVFINLITNAVQAMPEGGPLTIRTRVAPEEAHGPRAVVEVEDAGTGIPLERLQHVFEPFETSKPSGSGTGLGLPITKQIVESHGGTIELHPRRPNGICARVTLNLP